MTVDAAWPTAEVAEGWMAGPLDAGVAVEVLPDADPLPAAVEAEVSSLWERARARRPALFNGRVFTIERITPASLSGRWTEYRRVFAQLRRPELFDVLRLRPLAVNGLLECSDGLLLGRRHPDSVYMPGRWQAAPSGNVEWRGPGDDGVVLAAQLLAELEEELGVGAGPVSALRPVLAIEHARTHVVDVGFLLRVALSCGAVRTAAEAGGNREYDAFRPVGRTAIPGVIRELGAGLLPSARALLEAWNREHAAGR